MGQRLGLGLGWIGGGEGRHCRSIDNVGSVAAIAIANATEFGRGRSRYSDRRDLGRSFHLFEIGRAHV